MEVHSPGGGDYLAELAKELRSRRQDLLYHGKIGRQQSVYLSPEGAPDSMEASSLMVCSMLCLFSEDNQKANPEGLLPLLCSRLSNDSSHSLLKIRQLLSIDPLNKA